MTVMYLRQRRLNSSGTPKTLMDRQIELLRLLNEGENLGNDVDTSQTLLVREWQLRQILIERKCESCRKNRNKFIEESIGMSKYIDSVCSNPDCTQSNDTEKKGGFFSMIKKLLNSIADNGRMLLKKLQGAIRPTIILKQLGIRRNEDSDNSLLVDDNGKVLWDETTMRMILNTFVTGQDIKDTGLSYAVLGLSTSHKFEKMYTKVSPTVCREISKVAKRKMRQAFLEEVYATLEEKCVGMSREEIDVEKKKWENNDPDRMEVSIAVSYDMGWQKRSSGRKYDSMSGHGILVGCRTGQVIEVEVLSKVCNRCQLRVKSGMPVNKADHDCSANMGKISSSKGMEAEGAFRVLTRLHKNNKILRKGEEPRYALQFECLVTDDDSTMRAQLVHPRDASDKVARLPLTMKSITFYCDPGHRIKCWAKPFFKMAKMAKCVTNLTTSKVERFKRYIGYFLKQNRGTKDLKWFREHCYAPLEHLFNNHTHCDSSWCTWKESCEKGDHTHCNQTWCDKCPKDVQVADATAMQQKKTVSKSAPVNRSNRDECNREQTARVNGLALSEKVDRALTQNSQIDKETTSLQGNESKKHQYTKKRRGKKKLKRDETREKRPMMILQSEQICTCCDRRKIQDRELRRSKIEKEKKAAKNGKREPNYKPILDKYPVGPWEVVELERLIGNQTCLPVIDVNDSEEAGINNEMGEREVAKTDPVEPVSDDNNRTGTDELFFQCIPCTPNQEEQAEDVDQSIMHDGADVRGEENVVGELEKSVDGTNNQEPNKEVGGHVDERILGGEEDEIGTDMDKSIGCVGDTISRMSIGDGRKVSSKNDDMSDECDFGTEEVIEAVVDKYCPKEEENKANSYLVSDDGDVTIVFDDHKKGKLTERERRREDPNYYMCKFHDFMDYKRMKEEYEKYVTDDALAQCLHTYDTQKNESMNLVVAKYAPKNRTYAKSISLQTRVHVAVGVSIVRKQKFWSEVCRELGFESGTAMDEALRKEDIKYERKRNIAMTLVGKLRRQEGNFKRLKDLQDSERKDTEKRICKYKPGSGIGLGTSIGVNIKTVGGSSKGGKGTKGNKRKRASEVNSKSNVECAKIRSNAVKRKVKRGRPVATKNRHCRYSVICVPGHTKSTHKECIMNGKMKVKEFVDVVEKKILKGKLLTAEEMDIFDRNIKTPLVYQRYKEIVEERSKGIT